MAGNGPYVGTPLGGYGNPVPTSKPKIINYTIFSNLIDQIFRDFNSNLSLIESFSTFHILQKKSTKPNPWVSKAMSLAGLVAKYLKKSKHPALIIFGSFLKFGAKNFPNGPASVSYDFLSPHSDLKYFISETKKELSRYQKEISDNLFIEFKKAKRNKNLQNDLISLYKDLNNAFYFVPNRKNSFSGVHNALDEFTLIIIFEWLKVMSSSAYRPYILLENQTLQEQLILPTLNFINIPSSIILFLKNNFKDSQLLAFTDYSNFSKFFDFQENSSELIPIYYSWGGKNPPPPIGNTVMNQIAILAPAPPKHTRIIFKLSKNYFFLVSNSWRITHSEGDDVFIHFRNDLREHHSRSGYKSIEALEWEKFDPTSLGIIARIDAGSPIYSLSGRPSISTFQFHVFHHIRDFAIPKNETKTDLSKFDKYYNQ